MQKVTDHSTQRNVKVKNDAGSRVHAAVNCFDLCSVAFAFENCNAFHTFKVPRFPVPPFPGPRFQRPILHGLWSHIRVGQRLDPSMDWIGSDDCNPVFFSFRPIYFIY